MVPFWKNKIVFLSTSFALFIVGLPLVSIGSTQGPRWLMWGGLIALCLAALIPPVQRLCCGPDRKSDDEAGDEPAK